MEERDRTKINQCVDQIVEKLDMEKLWPRLLEHGIFYDDDPNFPKWRENWNNPEIMKDILLEVKTRGPDAYKNLLLGFEETDQHQFVEMLENCSINSTNNNNKNGYDTEDDQSDISCSVDDAYLSDLTYNPVDADGPLEVKVIKSTRFYDTVRNKLPVGTYPMRSCPRGLVLIITLIKYHGFHEVRNSAEYDEKNLVDLFQQMGFKVYTETNLTAAEIRQRIKKFSEDRELRTVDSSVVVISGHGDQNSNADDSVIMGVDHFGTQPSEPDREISYGEIINYFSAENCPSLENKPKMFIFQLCRGELLQTVVPNRNYKMNNHVLSLNLEIAGNKVVNKRNTNKSTRNYSDILIANSTLPDHVSYRDPKNGSWFIQILCEVFMKFAHNTHVSDLFDIVDDRLKPLRTGPDKNYGQTSVVKKIGFRPCYINPGLFEDDT